MREERGNLAGDFTIKEPFTLWGSMAGVVTVVQGSKFYLRGAVYGDLHVEDGGRVHVLGNVSGTIYVKPGSKVVMGGNVGGDVYNSGGRLFIEATATVLGRVRSMEGADTKLEPGSKVTIT